MLIELPNDFDFSYKDIARRNETHASRRVAVSVSQMCKANPKSLAVTIKIGWEVLELLGWKAGHDRVQFAENGCFLALSRKNGQYKLGCNSSGGNINVCFSSRRLQTQPTCIMGTTAFKFAILPLPGCDSEKMLLICHPFMDGSTLDAGSVIAQETARRAAMRARRDG